MTSPADPDAWQRAYEGKLAAVEERNNQMSQELEQLQITERSKDGQISVTVNSQGALVGLELGDALRQRNGNIVAAEVLRLAQSAQGQISESIQRMMQPYIGGTEAMSHLQDQLNAARPPQTDAFRDSDQQPPRRPRRDDGDEFGGETFLS